MYLTSPNSSPTQQRTPQVIGVMQSQNNNTGNRGPRPLEQVTCYKVMPRGGRDEEGEQRARDLRSVECMNILVLCCWVLVTGRGTGCCGVLVLPKVCSQCKQVHETHALLCRCCVSVLGYSCGDRRGAARPRGRWAASSRTCSGSEGCCSTDFVRLLIDRKLSTAAVKRDCAAQN